MCFGHYLPISQHCPHALKTMSSQIETFIDRFVAECDRSAALESMCDLFADLHASLARDFLKTYGTKKSKEPKEPKEAKKEVPKCQAKTAKGEDCPRKICDESEEFCAMHLKQSQKPKPEPKAKVEKKAKEAKKEVATCQAKTAKGDDCPRKCCADSDEFCVTHLKQSQKPKVDKKVEKKVKAPKKEKKIAEHNHVLSEKIDESVADNCELCQSHGNTLDPELVDEDFEGVSEDMQSRLQEILSNISELDESENDESVAGPSEIVEEEEEYDEGEVLDMPGIDAALNSDDEDEPEDDDI